MVTLRREMVSDTGRVRDYSNNRNDYANSARIHNKDNVSPEYLDYLWAELDRSERRKTLKPDEYALGQRLEGKTRSSIKNRETEYTTAHSRARSHNMSQNKHSVTGALDKKGVMAIVAYFLIVAVIATLIIVNGTGAVTFEPATGSQAELSTGAGVEVNPTAELPIISQDVLGVMILNDGSVENINLLEKSDSYSYQAETNWFDKVCDAISFIVGG